MPALLSQKFKPRILQKGLFIVFLPLLINSVLIFVLNSSLDRTAKLMEESRRQIIAINTLSRDIFAVTGLLTLGNNAMMNGAYNFFHPFIETYMATVEKDLDLVKAKLPEDLHFEQTQREVLALLNTQRAAFIKGEDKSLSRDELVIKLRRVKTWITLCGSESTLLNNMLEKVQSRFQQSVEIQQKERVTTGVIIMLALLLNLILACLLAGYFHRHITLRIGLLAEMARRLPARQPIKGNIGGKDELSDLAHELGEVSQELAQIAEYRRSLSQMMAHDVRSPLMSAMISVDLLEATKGSQLSRDGEQLLNETRESISDCLALVSDLLLLENLENNEQSPDLEIHDIKSIIAAAAGKIEPAARDKGIRIELEVGNALVRLDEDLIAMVVQRLLLSAIDRAPSNSIISVTSRELKGQLQVCVRDQGAPLDRADGANLFDKFYQAGLESDKKTGGLGLVVTRPIIALHGGEIIAGSDDAYNKVCFRLPLTSMEALPGAREQGGA